jgi:immune inhibitor A
MGTKFFAPILTSLIMAIFSVSAFAVPPTDEVIQKLKDDGLFDQYVQSMIEARAQGVNAGIADDGKGRSQFALSPGATFRVLVLLVDFPDKSYTGGWVAGSTADFDSLLFSDGINPTGSMKEFYIESSYGNFILEGDVAGWYTASQNASYYTNFCDGSRGMGAYPNNARRLVEEAVALADPDVDFSLYDNDGNNYVDGIFVVHAGTGYEETGDNCEIHSHQWSISADYRDGVYVTTYSIEPEESAGNQELNAIGVFCHEFGHVLGLPDLYDTDYSSRGIGEWGMMASGSYNGNSKRPAQFSAWSKMALGWLSPINVTSNQIGVEFPAVEWNPVVYRLWKNGQGGSQYFLIENRQKTGFDEYLPGSGLLIWHIDENVGGNSNDWHPRVFLEQADGRFDLQNNGNGGDPGDAFPDAGYHPHFHDKTTPDSRAYNTTSSQVAAWNISSSDSIMTADLDVFWSRPYLYLMGAVFSDVNGGDGDGMLEAGETIELTMTIGNDWKTASAAEVNMTIDDGTLNVTNGYALLGTIASGGSADNNGSPLVFEIPIDYTPRIDSFFFEITSDGGSFTSVLAVEENVGEPALLLVDDDNNDDVDTYYSSALYGRRLPYDLWNKYTSGTPGISELSKYDAVVWFTGDYRASPLSTGDISSMKDYLDAGGSLFLSGQAIAAQLSTLDPTFMSDYLKASYLSTSFVPILSPDAGSPNFADLDNIVITGASGASNQTNPDQIAAETGGVAELAYYGSPDLGAVSYSGSYKTMFFSFGFEAIVTGDYRFAERDTVYARVLDFLGVSSASGYPEVNNLEIGPGAAMNLLDHTPYIAWPYYDAGGSPQDEYHVQVGIDDDWSTAEMWDYGPVAGSDTSVVYAGSVLIDGQTYFARVRVSNGTQWSSWRTTQFRMNSVPGAPGNLDPDNLAGITDDMPVLQHQGAVDNELDPLTYDFEVYADSFMTTLVDQANDQSGGPGVVSWTVTVALDDESVYYWRGRASDGYEDGDWSSLASFWVNSVNQAPAAFDLVSPADEAVLTEMLPTFEWSASSESDLYDTLEYAFIMDTDPGFATADTVAGLQNTSYTVTDSISNGMDYYWKVVATDKFGGLTESGQVFSFSTWVPGDANSDGMVDVGDVVFLINYIFRGGAAPDPLSAGDANQDCISDVGDAVYILNYVFRDGPAPLVGCE